MLTDVKIYHDDLPGDLTRRLQKGGVVACDIETSGLDWRRDSIGTCQFHSSAYGTFLVKVRSQTETPLGIKTLLEDSRTTKIFHHAPFDLRFFRRVWGIRSRSVACTKVASKLAYPDKRSEDHSLQFLVREHLGIPLKKDARVSDWLSPSLTQEQLTYAGNDVRYLIELHNILQQEVACRGLQNLYRECCAFLPSHVELQMIDVEDVFSY